MLTDNRNDFPGQARPSKKNGHRGELRFNFPDINKRRAMGIGGGVLAVWSILSYPPEDKKLHVIPVTPTEFAGEAVKQVFLLPDRIIDFFFEGDNDPTAATPTSSAPGSVTPAPESTQPSSAVTIVPQTTGSTVPVYGSETNTQAPLPPQSTTPILLPETTPPTTLSAAAPEAFFTSESSIGTIVCNTAISVTIGTKENGETEFPYNAYARTTGNTDYENIVTEQAEQFFTDIRNKLNNGMEIPTQVGVTFTAPDDCEGYTLL